MAALAADWPVESTVRCEVSARDAYNAWALVMGDGRGFERLSNREVAAFTAAAGAAREADYEDGEKPALRLPCCPICGTHCVPCHNGRNWRDAIERAGDIRMDAPWKLIAFWSLWGRNAE
jgi:hypothetical protein